MTRAPGAPALAALFILCLALGLAACNEGPARAALADADQALAAARPELERYAPHALAGLRADAATSRRLLAAGHGTEALRIAQVLPERIAKAVLVADVNRQALAPAWERLAGALAAGVAACRARQDEIAASARMPRGLDPEAFEATKGELAAVEARFAQAETAYRAGDLPQAIRTGDDARTQLLPVAARLGLKLTTPAGAAPRPQSSPVAPAPTPATPARPRPPSKPAGPQSVATPSSPASATPEAPAPPAAPAAEPPQPPPPAPAAPEEEAQPGPAEAPPGRR